MCSRIDPRAFMILSPLGDGVRLELFPYLAYNVAKNIKR